MTNGLLGHEAVFPCESGSTVTDDAQPLSLEGQFLVASPELRDPNFVRSVVLLIRHNDEGAFGVVLNRPSFTSVAEVWSQVSKIDCKTREKLFVGGPVNGPLMAVHTQPALSDLQVAADLCFTGKPSHIEQLVAENHGPIRFIVGFAGWGPTQLEAELAEDAWLTTPANSARAFGNTSALWERAIRQVSDAALRSVLNIKQGPADSSLN